MNKCYYGKQRNYWPLRCYYVHDEIVNDELRSIIESSPSKNASNIQSSSSLNQIENTASNSSSNIDIALNTVFKDTHFLGRDDSLIVTRLEETKSVPKLNNLSLKTSTFDESRNSSWQKTINIGAWNIGRFFLNTKQKLTNI